MASSEGRRINEVFGFAVWWFEFINSPQDTKSGPFRAILGMAKKLRSDGYDLELVKRTLLTMRRRDIKVNTPYAIRWQSPERDKTWYEYARPQLPPLWDGLSVQLYDDNLVPMRAG